MDCVLHAIAAVAVRIHDVGTERDVILCDAASPSSGKYRTLFLRFGWSVDGFTPYLRLRERPICIDELAAEHNRVAIGRNEVEIRHNTYRANAVRYVCAHGYGLKDWCGTNAR